MRSLFRTAIAFTLVIAPLCASAQKPAQQPAPTASQTTAQQYNQLREMTQLDRPGAHPFHLKIDAQLYDIHGNTSTTGTIDEWWAAPNQYRIEIDSGSLHEVEATGQPAQLPPLTRASFLLNQLFQEIVHPLGPVDAPTTISKFKEVYEHAQLTCLRLHESFHVQAGPPTFCVEPGTENLRIGAHDFEVTLRNDVGTFAGAHIALSTTLFYENRKAISGKVTLITGFTPGASTPSGHPAAPTLQPAAPAAPADSSGKLSRKSSTGGHVHEKPRPIYPASARAAHIEGTVLIHAVITREGKLTSLVVLASPGDALSQSALDAVRQWHCDPYRLNGQLTEVNTIIPVTFKLNP